MGETIKFLARPGFIVREIADEIMLVPVNTGGVHINDDEIDQLPEFNGIVQLNDLALFLWQAIEKPKTLEELIEAVKSEFDTQGQDIESDILSFMDIGIQNQIIFLVKN